MTILPFVKFKNCVEQVFPNFWDKIWEMRFFKQNFQNKIFRCIKCILKQVFQN